MLKMKMKKIIDQEKFQVIMEKIVDQIYADLSRPKGKMDPNLCIIGIHNLGAFLAQRIAQEFTAKFKAVP